MSRPSFYIDDETRHAWLRFHADLIRDQEQSGLNSSRYVKQNRHKIDHVILRHKGDIVASMKGKV